MSSRNIENLKNASPTQNMDGDEDHGFFCTHRGQKKPECICFVDGAKQFALPWRLSGERRFTSGTIDIEVPDCTVTMEGKGLDLLWDYILREKVYRVTKADASQVNLGNLREYVESITVKTRE